MTIRTIYLVFIFFIFINPAFGQKKNKKTVLGIKTGISLPFSDFANKSMTYDAGFASAGGNIDVNIMRYSGKYIGFCADLGYTNMFFHENAYQSEYERILDGIGETSVDAGNYHVLHSAIGMLFKSPEYYQSEILLSGQLGYSISIHPGISVDHSVWGEINSVEQDVGWSLISSWGLQINHYVSEKYGIGVSYHRYFLNPRFRDKTGFKKSFYLPMKYQNINIVFLVNF